MKWLGRVAWLATMAACSNKASKADIDAYRSAQQGAQERLHAWQQDFDSAMADVKAGKWVPRPDLGACSSTIPKPLSDTDDGFGYPAFFLDGASWASFGDRVFNLAQLTAGQPVPEADRIAEQTKRLAEFVPFQTDVLVLYVDHEVKAKYVSDGYEPGSRTGRAWAWSAKTHKIICAGVFSGTTPDEVTAKVYAGEDSNSEIDSAMTLALARASERSALTNLVAAGPPPSP